MRTAGGTLASTTDGLGNATSYTYDGLGRLVRQTDALEGETCYTYDALGRRIALTDPEENTTTWAYDNLGRAIEETNQLEDTRSFSYDAAGRLTRRVDRREKVRDFDYDDLGQLSGEYWYNSVAAAIGDPGRTSALEGITFSYNAAGWILTAGDSSTAYVYTYDNLGRLESTTYDFNPLGLDLTTDTVLAYSYDLAGRLTEVAAAIDGTDDYSTSYTYDDLGRIQSITQDSQQGGNAAAAKRVDFVFDAAGRPSEINRYSDLSGTNLVAATDYLFDAAGRLIQLTHADGGTTFADYDLLYDLAGRITGFDIYSLIGGDDLDTDYTYDATNQLTDADYYGDWQDDEDYTYDLTGNRVAANGDNYTTGENNQLTSDGTYAYLYDAEGNREYRFEDNDSSDSITSGDTNIRQFVWDHRNRLVAVKDYADYTAYQSNSPSQVVEYAYDFGNRWVRKVLNPGEVDEEKTIFVYDGNQITLQFDKTGTGDMVASNLSHRYLWGTAVDHILADEQVTSLQSAGEVLWPLGDHLNSVRDVIDSSGTVKIHRVYDAFGNFTESPSTATHLFAFTARPFDADTLLQNNLHRWYDAQVGRWLSEDPIGYEGGISLYQYVGASPLRYFDPSGLACSRSLKLDIKTTHPVKNIGNIEGEVRGVFGTYDRDFLFGGSVSSDTAGTSGFIIGKTLKAKYKGYPDCCCDISESKIGFMAFYAVISETHETEYYTVPGTTCRMRGPRSTAEHEQWHTGGAKFDYEYYEKLCNIKLVRHLGYRGAATRLAALTQLCVSNAIYHRKPKNQSQCQKILEVCVDRLFFEKNARKGDSPIGWIVDHGTWHLGESTRYFFDNTPITWDPQQVYDELKGWW